MKSIKRAGSLIALLGSSVATAAIIVAYMAYSWGPDGTHSLKNVLLAPDVLEHLSYREVEGESGNGPQMVFHGIEFLGAGNKRAHEVALESYASFFNLVRNERSLPELTPAVEEAFLMADMGTLQVMVRPQSGNYTRVFQQVNFSKEGNHFRVELRVDMGRTEWAYYYRPGIASKASQIFSGGA